MLLNPRHSSLGWMARRSAVWASQFYGAAKMHWQGDKPVSHPFLIFHPFFLNGGEIGPEYLPQSSVSGLFN